MPHAFRHVWSLVAALAMLAPMRAAQALEHLTVEWDNTTQQLVGEVVIEDREGNLMLKTDEGALWPLSTKVIRSRTSDTQPLVALDKKQLAERLLQEMGPGFQLHESKHYVIVHNTTHVYARWCSSLLERLQKGFLAFWKKCKADVHEPETPLAVLVFGDRASYLKHARQELGDAAGSAIGYYSLQTNRIVMYDLTGSQAARREDSRRGNLKDITALLQTSQAEPLVATIIHEATHQIAYNCGLQTRYVDNPLWLSEGMAVYFETPNLNSNRLWSGTDQVNYARWDRFRANVRSGNAASLKTLIADDTRLRHPKTAVDAYAEAWAWNYFLIKWHPDEYTSYLKMLAEKPLLLKDDRESRIKDFQQHFGDNLRELEDEFFRQMSRINN